jgi:sec-independent protein translocase protein TatA
MRLGGQELFIIAIVLVLLFGGKKIPDLAKGLGEGIRNFKNSFKADEDAKDDKKQA